MSLSGFRKKAKVRMPTQCLFWSSHARCIVVGNIKLISSTAGEQYWVQEIETILKLHL